MIDSILAVIVLIIAGWAIAKNYDAKVVLFIAALVLLYSGLLLGVNFQRFPTLDAKKLVNAPKMSAHHRGICHF